MDSLTVLYPVSDSFEKEVDKGTACCSIFFVIDMIKLKNWFVFVEWTIFLTSRNLLVLTSIKIALLFLLSSIKLNCFVA